MALYLSLVPPVVGLEESQYTVFEYYDGIVTVCAELLENELLQEAVFHMVTADGSATSPGTIVL